MFENFASLHCMRIYNNKYRSRFFFCLPILLKVVISVYSVHIHIYDCWCLSPARPRVGQLTTYKNGFFLPLTHKAKDPEAAVNKATKAYTHTKK